MAIYYKIKPQTVGQVANTKFSDLKNNSEFTKTIESIANPTILNEYPKTTPELAGKRFFYRTAEWHYMTKDEINAAGWTNLVSVGFPALVDKHNPNRNIYFQNSDSSKGNKYDITEISISLVFGQDDSTYTLDFLGLGDPTKIRKMGFLPYGLKINKIINANLLINLEDLGTQATIFSVNNFTLASTINDFFTQLPPTTKSATINIVNNGAAAAGCNPAIATAKGYTIVR